MSSQHSRSSIDSLPKQFVASLRTLFAILDERSSGFVYLSDIRSRWKDGDVDGLPPGVLDALAKVTAKNGQLTFERFVAGLRIAILRVNSEQKSLKSDALQHPEIFGDASDEERKDGFKGLNIYGDREQLAKPSSFSDQRQRTRSMPQLNNPVKQSNSTDHRNFDSRQQPSQQPWVDIGDRLFEDRRPGDGRSAAIDKYGLVSDKYSGGRGIHMNSNKRREPRRHTLSSGVDFNMIKRIKQLEQEKDVLVQGLETVNKAREWYLQQIKNVQERQKYMADSRGDFNLEAHTEKLNLLMARSTEVNQQLKALIDSSEKGLPFHMNLAMTKSPLKRRESLERENYFAMIKNQNRQLTKEVGDKSEHIAQMEAEKRHLLKELFTLRYSKRKSQTTHDDTTFI